MPGGRVSPWKEGLLPKPYWDKVRIDPNGCWEWTANRDREGYGILKYGGKNRRPHRVMWSHFNGPIPCGMVIAHRCDNPPCVRIDHLYLATQEENLRDMTQKGRRAYGERHGKTKLREDQVREIRRLHASGIQQRQICRVFSLSPTTVCNIVHRRCWGHLS